MSYALSRSFDVSIATTSLSREDAISVRKRGDEIGQIPPLGCGHNNGEYPHVAMLDTYPKSKYGDVSKGRAQSFDLK